MLVAVMAAVLGETLIASAQVSSGSPEAAQQNAAKQKKTTDKPGQNDQQNATTNRPQEAPTREAPKSDR
jgi:hypothetical protein